MATGQLPFGQSNIESAVEAILHSNPVKPRALNPSIPAELEAIILKALQKERTARYTSAAEMRIDLDRVLRGEISLPERVWRSGWVRMAGALALIVGAFVLARVWMARPARDA